MGEAEMSNEEKGKTMAPAMGFVAELIDARGAIEQAIKASAGPVWDVELLRDQLDEVLVKAEQAKSRLP